MADEQVTELDLSESEPTVGLREYVDSRIDDLKELIQARFTSEQRALQVAKAEIDRRLEAMNELREQIQTERGSFASRDYVDQRIDSLAGRVTRAELDPRRHEPSGDG